MLRFLWMGLLFYTASGSLWAQKKVLPVRIDQKWGYISTKGKVVVPPQYDGLAEVGTPYHGSGPQLASQYRMVSIGNRCGLLDKYRREVFPPVYQRVHVLTDLLFAVVTDNGGYQVVNKDRQLIYDASQWDDVQTPQPGNAAWANILLVKKDFKWGVIDLSGKMILPAQYAELKAQRDCPSLYVVSNSVGGLKGMVDLNNKVILPMKNLDIIAFQENSFAVKDPEGWAITGRAGIPLSSERFIGVHRINRHFYGLAHGNGIALFSVKEKRKISELDVNYRYFALDEDFMYKAWRRDSVPMSVITPKGEPLKIGRTVVPSMLPSSLGYYPISIKGNINKRFWGLWKQGLDTLSVPCIYTKIHPFKDSFAIVELDKHQGVINAHLQEIAPPIFKKIVIQDKVIKASTDTSLVVLKIMPGLGVGNAEAFGNVQTIKVAEIDSFLELSRTAIPRRFDYSDYNFDRAIPKVISMHQYRWVLDDKTALYALKKGDSLLLSPFAEQVIPIRNRDLGLVFSREKTTQNAFTRLAIRDSQTPLCRMAIFDFLEGRFLTDFKYLGLRFRDFMTQETAVFIDLQGKMGLIDTAGIEVKNKDGQPLRCAYIGEFSGGKARFSPNGILQTLEENNANMTWELPPLDYLYELSPPKELPSSFRFREYWVASSSTQDSVYWGVMDSLGTTIIAPVYDYVQGVTPSGVIARKGIHWGVLNFEGDTVLGFRYRWITDYGTYWKIVVRDPNEFFFPAKTNQKPPPLPQANTAISGQLIPMKQDSFLGYAKSTKNNKYYLTDTLGKRLSGLGFDKIYPFYKYRTIGQIGAHDYLINKKGGYQVLYGNDRAVGWAEGFAVVDTTRRRPEKERKHKYIYLNSEGVDEFGLAFSDAKPFNNGLALVRKGYFWGTINRFGLYVSPPKYVKIEQVAEGVQVKVPTMMGLADKDGKIIIPPRFDRVEMVGGAYFRLERGDKIGYTKLDGEWIWKVD